MSDEISEARDALDARRIAELLETQLGYAIDLFGMLYVRNLESGEFAVGTEERDEEVIYSDAREAADAFMTKRRELQLGSDFERIR